MRHFSLYPRGMQKYEHATVTRDSDKFQLRLPGGMRQKISEVARENGRSMNAEIVDRLQGSFSGDLSLSVDLLSRQNGLISFLCECLEQLTEVSVQTDSDKSKIEMIKALYLKATSDEVPPILKDKI